MTAEARLQRVKKLKEAVDQYVSQEKKRIDNEVASLEKILSGRTGGAGVQTSSSKVAEAIAAESLEYYLSGE